MLPNVTSGSPQVSDGQTDFKADAHREGKAVALRTTGTSFSVPTVAAGFLPQAFRSASLLLSSAIWTAVQESTTRTYNYIPAPSTGHALMEDLAKYGPFIPAFVLQNALMDPKTATGTSLQKLQSMFTEACQKSALTKPFAKYPVAGIGTRVASQLGAAFTGSVVHSKYAEKVRGAEIHKSDVPGKLDVTKLVETMKNHEDWTPITALFALAAAAYTPAGRAGIARMFNIGLTQKLAGAKIEAIQSTALVSLAAASNVYRRNYSESAKPE